MTPRIAEMTTYVGPGPIVVRNRRRFQRHRIGDGDVGCETICHREKARRRQTTAREQIYFDVFQRCVAPEENDGEKQTVDQEVKLQRLELIDLFRCI
jgi:hypothetical protein